MRIASAVSRLRAVLLLVAWAVSCNSSAPPPARTADDARAFVKDANDTLLRLGIEAGQAGWVQQTFITPDTEAINARASQAYMTAATSFAKRATQLDGVDLPALPSARGCATASNGRQGSGAS